MLIESKNVKQIKDESFRRWFSDENFDLIVWYDENKSIHGFQLCYDKSKGEHALTWRKRKGYLHEKIDDGEKPGEPKKTPILVPDGLFHKNKIAELFKSMSTNIDHEVAQFVYEKLVEYS